MFAEALAEPGTTGEQSDDEEIGEPIQGDQEPGQEVRPVLSEEAIQPTQEEPTPTTRPVDIVQAPAESVDLVQVPAEPVDLVQAPAESVDIPVDIVQAPAEPADVVTQQAEQLPQELIVIVQQAEEPVEPAFVPQPSEEPVVVAQQAKEADVVVANEPAVPQQQAVEPVILAEAPVVDVPVQVKDGNTPASKDEDIGHSTSRSKVKSVYSLEADMLPSEVLLLNFLNDRVTLMQDTTEIEKHWCGSVQGCNFGCGYQHEGCACSVRQRARPGGG